MRPSRSLSLLLSCLLCACAGKRMGTPDNEPTLKSLAGRQVVIDKDPGIPRDDEKAIAAYKDFLRATTLDAQRAEALRRLGDLEMDSAESRLAARSGGESGDADYRAAIAHYEENLKAYPKDPGNDRVLYQLARAHEQGGRLDTALATLDRLVRDFPDTRYRDEAHFRRGELLFTARDYVGAERAYATVLEGDEDNPYRERALYMQGWSLFKLGRLEDALASFFEVLDLGLADVGDEDLAEVTSLSNADRELVEDTLRVMSLSLENLRGAESIAGFVTTELRRGYEFRVYRKLGELYLRQERVKDAADTFGAFARRQPLHAQAPQLQAEVIAIYQKAGFDTLALEAKKEYVERYGAGSRFRQANAEGWERAQPLVKTHLAELARHYHARAQQGKASADYQEAVRWYRSHLESFPDDADAGQTRFLLAELLFEDQRFAEAVTEYEHTAYGYPVHARSADAGYAALLGYAGQQKRSAPAELPGLRRKGVASALRFADAFPGDPRTGAVLADAADTLHGLRDAEQAVAVAARLLALQPPANAAQRRLAWTVMAHSAFERQEFERAERAYTEVLALTAAKDPARGELTERLAAAVYKQGEQARDAGQARGAVSHFERVAALAPQSAVRATAQYDAAAALIGLKDWDGAAGLLEDFRQRYPRHARADEVTAKLAAVYSGKSQWARAAAEFERLSLASKDTPLAREALWQAAELYDKAAARPQATKAFERYLAQNPQPFERALEARSRLAALARADGQAARHLAWMKDIFQLEQAGGAARTPRTRYLGASAALALAEPAFEAYRKVTLTEPLARQLKLKKGKMEEALKAYAVASDYGVAEIVTASTYHVAALYQDFGKALLGSQRPKKLSASELEQYNVLLEEQAFPFEEKAIELHELNARRAQDGLYDTWVQRSFAALRELRPVRYGKSERSEGAIDAIR